MEKLLVRVDDTPRTTGIRVIIGDTFFGSFIEGIFRVEGVSVFIFGRSDWSGTWHCIALDDGVFVPVELWINTETEEMLMVMRVDARVNLSSPAMGIFTGIHNIGIQNTSKFQFELDISICVE